jgi:hypothetical protein
MILPKNKFGAKKAAEPVKTKYENPTSVKMFMMSVEDVFTNRYKNAWFTLLKFTEKVEEKSSILEELKEFGRTTQMEKLNIAVDYQIPITGNKEEV